MGSIAIAPVLNGEILGSPVRKRRGAPEDARYRTLLGEHAWQRLPLATRNRFSHALTRRDAEVYRGTIEETQLSGLGKVLALCLLPFGQPLPVESCKDAISAMVCITECSNRSAQVWTRSYCRENGFPQVIASQKRFAGPTGLEEQVGHFFGMTLRVSEENRALVFQSCDYFLNVFGMKLRLPRWMSPGALRVEHRDIGNGAFEFILRLHHRYFGELLFQRAVFHDMKEG
ncbi:MAG: hypothetical protein CMK07_07090 [Ponticaulis sp.]|nr:hypothetical protein [Ponticaulis sp.]